LIIAHGALRIENYLVLNATLNGQVLKEPFLSWSDLNQVNEEGSPKLVTLEFWMGDKPAKDDFW